MWLTTRSILHCLHLECKADLAEICLCFFFTFYVIPTLQNASLLCKLHVAQRLLCCHMLDMAHNLWNAAFMKIEESLFFFCLTIHGDCTLHSISSVVTLYVAITLWNLASTIFTLNLAYHCKILLFLFLHRMLLTLCRIPHMLLYLGCNSELTEMFFYFFYIACSTDLTDPAFSVYTLHAA